MRLITVFSYVALQSINFSHVIGERISKEKCNQYRNTFPQISHVFDDNEEDAALKEFPFMARIGNDNNLNGILISEKFVLTVAPLAKADAKYVILGDLDMGTRTDDTHSQYVGVMEVFTHPEYSRDLTFNLKLLMLTSSVKFDEFVRPACLPQSESTISQQLMEIGWGQTNIRSNNLLHKVKLNYISNGLCQERFKFIRHQEKLMENIDNGTIFCATTNEGDRDMCLVGVLGPFINYVTIRSPFSRPSLPPVNGLHFSKKIGFNGAAVLNRDQRSTLSEVMGLATTNTGCNDTYPTVFVRISESLNWIESVIWPDEIAIEVETKTMSTTQLPTSTNSIFERKIILISLTIILTITILSLILCAVVACFQLKNNQEIGLNIRFNP